jgi:hypothetical protein
VWSRSGKQGSLGLLKAANVLGVFGPSSFGIRAGSVFPTLVEPVDVRYR